MAQAFDIRTFSIDSNDWYPIVTSIACNYWSVRAAADCHVRTNRGDSNTEDDLPAGAEDGVTAPPIVMPGLVSSIPTAPRFPAGTAVVYIKSQVGSQVVVARFVLMLLLALLARPVFAQRTNVTPVLTNQTATLSSATCAGTGCITANTQGFGTVGIQVTGSWSGTLQFVGSVDKANFSALNCTPINSSTAVTTATGNGVWTCSAAGLAQVQVGFNGPNGVYTSGSAVVTIQPAPSGGNSAGGGGGGGSAPSGTIGAAVPSTASPGAVKDASGNLAYPALDAGGRLIVDCGAGCSAASDTVGSTVALNGGGVVASVAVTGDGGVGVLIAAGTLAGTIIPELSYDGGTTWATTTQFYDPQANTFAASLIFTNPNAATQRTILVGGGVSNVRVRVSSYTSGTANATLRATQNTGATFATQVGVWNVGQSGTWTVNQGGTWTVNQGGTWTVQPGNTANTTAWLVSGGLTNNNAAPSTNNFGVLPARANAAVPSWTEGDQVLQSADLHGTTRVGLYDTTGTAVALETDYTHNTALTVASTSGPMMMCRSQAAAPGAVGADDDATLVWCLRNGSLVANIAVGGTLLTATGTSLNINCTAGCGAGTQYTHNTALTPATTVGTMAVGRSSASAPTDVSADNNAVMAWYLRSGAQAVQPTFGGGLAAVGNGSQAGGNVQRVTIANDSTGQVQANAGSGTFTVGQANGANLHVDCDSGCSSSPAPADENAFTPGSTSQTPTGGFFQTTATNNALTNLQMGAFQVTAQRALFSNLRNASGTEIGTTTNAVFAGSVYNTTAPAPTNGTGQAIQSDQAGNTRTVPGIATATLTGWTSGSALNATQNIFTNSGVASVQVLLQQTSTITGGAITFEVSFDGTNWVTIPADAVLDPTSTTYAQISLPYTLVANTNKAFLLQSKGWQGLRIKLSTQIIGSATVTPVYTLIPYSQASTVVALSPTAANFNATVSGTVTTTPPANASTNVAQWNGAAVASPDANSYPITTTAATATATAAVSACNILSAASTNSTNCKGSAGNFYGYEIYNTTTTVYYLRMYNASSAPTCSSATGFIRTIPIPPAAAAGQVGGAVSNQPEPTNYGTGIGYCITGGSSSTDNTNAATGIFGEIRYK